MIRLQKNGAHQSAKSVCTRENLMKHIKWSHLSFRISLNKCGKLSHRYCVICLGKVRDMTHFINSKALKLPHSEWQDIC